MSVLAVILFRFFMVNFLFIVLYKMIFCEIKLLVVRQSVVNLFLIVFYKIWHCMARLYTVKLFVMRLFKVRYFIVNFLFIVLCKTRF